MDMFIGVFVFVVVLFLVARALRLLHRRPPRSDVCDICQFPYDGEDGRFEWDIDGRMQTLCARCNKKLESKIASERFDAYFAEREGSSVTAECPEPRRETIPSQVKREVWQRDGGACVECGSRELLEFDHIIPVSRGGANTTRNLQLLCERCNRVKAASIQ